MRYSQKFESWYPINCQSSADLTVFTPTLNRLYALPFYSEYDLSFSKLAFNVLSPSGHGGVARLGLYKSDQKNLYPTELITDYGQLAVTSEGVKSYASNQMLEKDNWYWFTMIFGEAAATLRGVAAYSGIPIFGLDKTLSPSFRIGIYVPQIYEKLPQEFPVDGAPLTGGFPLIAFKVGVDNG